MMRCKLIGLQSVSVCVMFLAAYVLGVSNCSAATTKWEIAVEVGSEVRTGTVSVVEKQLDTTVFLDLGADGFKWYAEKAWPLVLPETMTIHKGAMKGELDRLVVELDEFQGRSRSTEGLAIAVDSCLHILSALRVLPSSGEDVFNEFGTFRAERTTLSDTDIVVAKGGVEYHLQMVDLVGRITNLNEGVYLSGWKYFRSEEKGTRCFASYFRNASGMDNMCRRVTLYNDFWNPYGSERVHSAFVLTKTDICTPERMEQEGYLAQMSHRHCSGKF